MAKRDITVLTHMLKQSVPQADGLTEVKPLSTGHSNETYLLEGAGLVLRMPPSETPLVDSAHSVTEQAVILQRLSESFQGPFLPAVRHIEHDPDILGAPFYLMDYVPGETFSEYCVPDWLANADNAFRASVLDQYVQAIIAVHQHGPLDALGDTNGIADELARWRRVAVAASNDRLLDCIDTLARIQPGVSGPPTLVHGDPKPQNTLFAEGTLTALLDWEMSFNGEPLWDLGYVLIFFEGPVHDALPGCAIPGMPSREQIIAAWEAGTGRSATGIEWYEAASIAKVGSLVAYGAYLGDQGLTSDERLKTWGPFAEMLITSAESETEAAVRLFTNSKVTTEGIL